MKRAVSLFRGSEFPRWLLLAGLALAGWVVVLTQIGRLGAQDESKADRTADSKPLPEPDDRLEFQGVVDREPLSLRDNPAYLLLLDRVRETPPKQLAAESRRDVLYGQLINRPQYYRGLPIRIEGTALQILEQLADGTRFFPKGRYYEAYVVSGDSDPYLWNLIFESAPEGLPIGGDLHQHLVFNGYFFKLMPYRAKDSKAYVLPVVIGRVQYLDLPDKAPGWSMNPWWMAALVAILLFLMLRWWIFMRTATRARAARVHSSLPVSDQIDPEALSAWLNSVEPDDEPEAEDE